MRGGPGGKPRSRRAAKGGSKEAQRRDREWSALTVLSALPDMVYVIARDGTYLRFRPAKGQEPIVPPNQFLGKRIPDVLPKGLAEQWMRHIERALDSGKAQAFVFQATVGGHVCVREVHVAAIGPDRVVVFCRDVTERLSAVRLLPADPKETRKSRYGLTPREFDILGLIAAGRADKEIAQELEISPLTVHKHVGNILAKMGAASRTQAGIRALRERLLE